MTILWIIIFITLTIVELITINMVTIWFALSALITSLISLYIKNKLVQLGIFTILSFIILILSKKASKLLTNFDFVATNLDQVLGKTAIVTADILKNKYGEVKVLGKVWTAYSDKEIKKNEKVKVLAIDGVKLKVEKKEE